MKTSKKWVIVLQGTIIIVLAVFLSVLSGCANPATGAVASTVTTAQAVTATQSVVGAINATMGSATGVPSNPTSGQTYKVTYTSPYGISLTGTETPTTDSSGNVTSATFKLTITFDNYTDSATGYTVNGSVTFTATENSTGASGSITTNAALTLSGGKVTTESWDVTNFTSSGGDANPQFSFTGNVTCNGVSFNADSLSLGASTEAGYAAFAVIDGIKTLSNNSSSCIPSGTSGTISSCSLVAGVNVSGTYSSNSSGTETTYILEVTFSNYADAATGYTVTSGAITVVLKNDNSTSPPTLAYLSMTGGPITFSGGVVKTQTWNNIVFAASGGPGSGTISSDGTLFDVRTL